MTACYRVLLASQINTTINPFIVVKPWRAGAATHAKKLKCVAGIYRCRCKRYS